MTEIESVLVTGGCGFVGANLVRFLRERTPWSVRVVDDLRAGDRSHVDDGLADVRVGNVAEPSILDDCLEGVDAVVHLASQTGVAPSVEDPERDFVGNAATTFRTLEGCRRRGIDRFVFASSGAAVGDVPPPIHEDLVPRPLSPYGAGKLVGEAYCQAFAGSFGMQTVALRFSNVYGPWSAHKKNAVPNFIKRCLKDEPIVIYGDGTKSRDFIYADDLCDAIHRSLTADGIGGEIFQLATGVETSVLDLAKLVQHAVGSSNEVQFEAGLPGEVAQSWADISKVRRVLGFEPHVPLAEGLATTAEWYRAHWQGL
ncbi:MAG: NAD-dependent epimerase/dehydratase family protein [Actinobacteria bacterium]|nr:NAD-dependent epimerase/dehydratase family protein [Actinomycetota bacterium]